MPCNILTIPEFDKNIKILAKRYRNIEQDLKKLIDALQNEPTMGTHIVNNCYKIRVPNSSVPTGKSKGFRVITYYIDTDNTLYLLSIYSKSDTDNISDSTITELLKEIK